jgi:hypothetical protein
LEWVTLLIASSNGEAAEVTRLLVLNSPINHRESGFQATPFIKAALEGHIEVVALLANRGKL